MNRRIGLICVTALFVFILAGCGKSEGGRDESGAAAGSNTAEIKKDGAVTNVIEEDFDPDLYDEESLEEFIIREASLYNNEAGKESVTVRKLEIRKKVAALTMEYRTVEDFSAFNGYSIFCGTVAEAYDSGYDLDIELLDADFDPEGGGESGGTVITKQQLLEMGSRKIIIAELPADETLTIRASGKILYQSGADSVKKDTAVVSGGGDGPAYIVYK